jgi:hypothetical protein
LFERPGQLARPKHTNCRHHSNRARTNGLDYLMESSGGWQFWLEDSGSVRQFMVAEPDEIKARQCLRKNQPNGKILSRKIVPENVIQILGMKPGGLCEWVASTQGAMVGDATPT